MEAKKEERKEGRKGGRKEITPEQSVVSIKNKYIKTKRRIAHFERCTHSW